jgi:flagellar biosynthesis protein FlhF
MSECLAQVKASLGTQAVILHTRQLQRRAWMGLRRREVVEITAGVGMAVAPRPARTVPPKPPVTSRAAGAVATAPQPPGRELLGSSAAGNIAVLALNREMESIRQAIRELTTQVRSGSTPDVPEELFDYYRRLIESEVAEELARDLIRTIKVSVRPEHLSNADFVREKLLDHLEKLVPVAGPIARTKPAGAHVVALIGPTGVGKTTTIAKLAAHLKLRERRRVALITIDTYRIAAVDQLKRYADILGAPLKVVNTPEEIREAVAAMSDFDFVLVDTAGRSPRDTLKLSELRSFIAAASVDEVHLVLSSTMGESCVNLAVERFGEVRFEKVIFTKLDESSHVGVVLNVIHRLNKALSYVTTGQDVPADIEVGHGRRLAQLILEKAS